MGGVPVTVDWNEWETEKDVWMKGKCRGKGENEAFYEENKRKMKTMKKIKGKNKIKFQTCFLFYLFYFFLLTQLNNFFLCSWE